MSLQKLSQAEQRLYQLVARQYLAQFYPAFCYSDTTVELAIAGGCFLAKARTETAAGWKQLFRREQQSNAELRSDDASVYNAALPPLVQGQQLTCTAAQVLEKYTRPPQAFTDATLLAAMTGISRYVKDETIRKILRDTDGLGTEATRAGIIELLFKRGFLQRDGKQICATSTGKALIAALPEQAVLPDMTARWEAALNAICQRQQSYQAFMQPLLEQLHELITAAATVLPSGLPQQPKRVWRKKKPAGNHKTAASRYRRSTTAVTGINKRN